MSSDGPRRPSRGIVTTRPRSRCPSGARRRASGPVDGRRPEPGKPGSLVDPGGKGSGGGVSGFGLPGPARRRDRGRQRLRLFGSLRLTRPTRESTRTRAASARRGKRQGQSWRGGTNRRAIRGEGCRQRLAHAVVDSSMRKGAPGVVPKQTSRSRRSKGESPGLGRRANPRTLMTTSWLQRPATGPPLPPPKVLLGASSGSGGR